MSKVVDARERIEQEFYRWKMSEKYTFHQERRRFAVNIPTETSTLEAYATFNIGEKKHTINFTFPIDYPWSPFRARMPFSLDHPKVVDQVYSIPQCEWKFTQFWYLLDELAPILFNESLQQAPFLDLNDPLFIQFTDDEVYQGMGLLIGAVSGTLNLQPRSPYSAIYHNRYDSQYINAVDEDSPAARKGIRPGWIILDYFVQVPPKNDWHITKQHLFREYRHGEGVIKGILFCEPPIISLKPVASPPTNPNLDTLCEQCVKLMTEQGLLLTSPLKDHR
jgi:hypothetical protein